MKIASGSTNKPYLGNFLLFDSTVYGASPHDSSVTLPENMDNALSKCQYDLYGNKRMHHLFLKNASFLSKDAVGTSLDSLDRSSYCVFSSR